MGTLRDPYGTLTGPLGIGLTSFRGRPGGELVKREGPKGGGEGWVLTDAIETNTNVNLLASVRVRVCEHVCVCAGASVSEHHNAFRGVPAP